MDRHDSSYSRPKLNLVTTVTGKTDMLPVLLYNMYVVTMASYIYMYGLKL